MEKYTETDLRKAFMEGCDSYYIAKSKEEVFGDFLSKLTSKEPSVTSPSLNEKVLRAVDVTQRLPEKDGNYFTNEGEYSFRKYHAVHNWFNVWGVSVDGKITHWYEEISLSVGEEAVSFAEWIENEKWNLLSKEPHKWIKTEILGDDKYATSQELYQIFLKREGK